MIELTNHSIRSYKGISPTLTPSTYIDPAAIVIGNVTLGEDSSLWPLVVVRGDVNSVHIGKNSNIQDGSVIHESRPTASNPKGFPVSIGDDVTIGHKVLLHGCNIGNRVLVGMGAIVMDGVIIEDDVIVGAGAMVTPGKHLQSGHLYTGSPARQIRPLTPQELKHLAISPQNYIQLKNDYMAG